MSALQTCHLQKFLKSLQQGQHWLHEKYETLLQKLQKLNYSLNNSHHFQSATVFHFIILIKIKGPPESTKDLRSPESIMLPFSCNPVFSAREKFSQHSSRFSLPFIQISSDNTHANEWVSFLPRYFPCEIIRKNLNNDLIISHQWILYFNLFLLQAVNENSLKQLNEYIESASHDKSFRPARLTFYLRNGNNGSGKTQTHPKIPIG